MGTTCTGQLCVQRFLLCTLWITTRVVVVPGETRLLLVPVELLTPFTRGSTLQRDFLFNTTTVGSIQGGLVGGSTLRGVKHFGTFVVGNLLGFTTHDVGVTCSISTIFCVDFSPENFGLGVVGVRPTYYNVGVRLPVLIIISTRSYPGRVVVGNYFPVLTGNGLYTTTTR